MDSNPPSPTPPERHYNVPVYFNTINDEAMPAYRGEYLRVGSRAPGFRLHDINGVTVDLDELLTTGHVAIVFGCASAPPLVRETPSLEKLHRERERLGCQLVFVYTREIHPNEPLPPDGRTIPSHDSYERKVEQARSFASELGLTMTVAVDDLDGKTHRAYGSLPHSMAVVHRGGTLVHRSEKASASLLSIVLENLRQAPPVLRLEKVRVPGKEHERHFDAPTPTYSETLWMR